MVKDNLFFTVTLSHYHVVCLIQEEIEAQIKADKIKLALEKLKEAKVKKVRRPNSEVHFHKLYL